MELNIKIPTLCVFICGLDHILLKDKKKKNFDFECHKSLVIIVSAVMLA